MPARGLANGGGRRFGAQDADFPGQLGLLPAAVSRGPAPLRAVFGLSLAVGPLALLKLLPQVSGLVGPALVLVGVSLAVGVVQSVALGQLLSQLALLQFFNRRLFVGHTGNVSPRVVPGQRTGIRSGNR